MTGGDDSHRRDPIAGLRDELAERFLQVARDEPRLRLRRRLRYAGLTLVGALLVVPAAFAISGEAPDRVVHDAELASVAACEARALAPAAAPTYERIVRPGRTLYRIRPAVRPAPPPPLELGEDCASPARPPLLARERLRGRAAIQLPPPAGRTLAPAVPPAVRADCLTIRARGGALEAQPCAVPAPPPARIRPG